MNYEYYDKEGATLRVPNTGDRDDIYDAEILFNGTWVKYTGLAADIEHSANRIDASEVPPGSVEKSGTSEGAVKAWETRHVAGEGKSFEVGGIKFTPIQRDQPYTHWAFRIDETGQVFDPGTGGVSGKSVPKMIASLQDLFTRDSKGNTDEFRRQWGLANVTKYGTSAGAIKAWETIHANMAAKAKEKEAAGLKGSTSSANQEHNAPVPKSVGPTPKNADAPVATDKVYPTLFVKSGQYGDPAVNANAANLYNELDRAGKADYFNLPMEERKAIVAYSDGSSYINKAAAGRPYPNPKPGESIMTEAEAMNAVRHLDSVMAQSKIPIDVTVYRGMAMRPLNEAFGLNSTETSREDALKALVGAVYTEKAFASTTLKPTFYAYSNAANETGKIGLKISVPAGSSGLFLGPRSMVPSEEEVILPRGSQFLIKKVVTNSSAISGTSSYLEVELLPTKGA